MNINKTKGIVFFMKCWQQHYNPKKFWYMRSILIDKSNNKPLLIKFYYLFRCKRMEAFNNASTGINLNSGCVFKAPPILRHGLNGIIISHFAIIGKNVEIYQQVTIGQDNHGDAPVIEDNVIIGAGARIIGKVIIGEGSVIGANAVVVKDVPPRCTVAGVPAKIIKQGE